MINHPVIIHLNAEDLLLLKEYPILNTLPRKKLFSINPKPIETAFGFMIASRDASYSITFTFESILEKHYKELSMIFMNIFPVFEVSVKSAIEIDRDKKSGRSD